MNDEGAAPTQTLVFLSHNKGDAEEARTLGVHLQLVGASVWLDEWEIEPGDSISARLNEGLKTFDVFLVIWSANAARSRWVGREVETAIHSTIDDPNRRIVPVLLDETPLPPLLAPIKALDYDDPAEVVRRIMGFASERDRLRAIQEVLDSLAIEVSYFYGYGPIVACPRCGAPPESLEAWGATDYERDDEYAGVRCTECQWNDGGEI
jgi:hypothetical protein